MPAGSWRMQAHGTPGWMPEGLQVCLKNRKSNSVMFNIVRMCLQHLQHNLEHRACHEYHVTLHDCQGVYDQLFLEMATAGQEGGDFVHRKVNGLMVKGCGLVWSLAQGLSCFFFRTEEITLWARICPSSQINVTSKMSFKDSKLPEGGPELWRHESGWRKGAGFIMNTFWKIITLIN